MAKVIMPLLSGKVRGKLGDIVFFNRYGKQIARMRTIPTNPQTTKQVITRTNIGLLAKLWSGALSQVTVKKVNKATWTTSDITISLTAQQKQAFASFQAYMKSVMTSLMSNQNPTGVTIV